VVHGHSAHVPQGVEVYQGRPILYDCGDFVDDYVDREDVVNKRSGLFELVVADGDLRALRAVPTVIADETVDFADGTAATWARETLRERSAPFGTTVERAADNEGVVIPLGA
jgi:Putative enzyme of poly-gamma-glutamate biosynthesis (capsule formation)